MKEQSSFRERAKFSWIIMRSRWRIPQSPMPNEHPVYIEFTVFINIINQGNNFDFQDTFLLKKHPSL